MRRLLVCLVLAAVQPAFAAAAAMGSGAEAGPISARFLAEDGESLDSIVDGRAVTLDVTLAAPVTQTTAIELVLLPEGRDVASCEVPAGGATCTSGPVATLGWAWDDAGERRSSRLLELRSTQYEPVLLELSVAARPTVLVHGFTAGPAAWSAYVGQGGFLATIGVDGYVVGDIDLGPAMNMGQTANPTMATNTVAENAAVLAMVIERVKQLTGAPMVDVVAHSMGGLVARYYVGRLMAERDIAQLVMLGTPNLGSPCAALPAALGFYLPAALELRPGYLRQIFNPQLDDPRDVPLEALAGTPITERFKAPCTDVPSDLVVDKDSASGSGGRLAELPVLHTDLTSSDEVFERFVSPTLRRSAGSFDDPRAVATPPPTVAQSTHVYTGTVAPGAPVVIDVDLDAVAVASFALFDPSSSLGVQVHGASGAEIELSPETHGLVTVDDPSSLMHLGYGFAAPRPGAWRVTVHAGPRTPGGGAPFALMARVVGGAVVTADVSQTLPVIGSSVGLSAHAEGLHTSNVEVRAVITGPDGVTDELAMRPEGDAWFGSWRPATTGVHGIDVVFTGTSAEGLAVERTVPLAVEVRPERPTRWLSKAAGALAVSLFSVGFAPLVAGTRRLRVRPHRR